MSTPERVELDPADLPPRGVYPWLTAGLIPRAIAWVSTVGADGVDNLAPHSFTTVAGVDPPTLCFVSVGTKDTLRNIRASGDFVLHIGAGSHEAPMNDSATPFPPEVSEIEAAGLTRQPSVRVSAPRVAEAPIAFECRVSGEHVIGSCTMVFGEVVHISVRADCLAADGLPDAARVAPLARLGRDEWSRLGELFTLKRLTYDEWRDGRRS